MTPPDYKEKAAELLNALDALKGEDGRWKGMKFPSDVAMRFLQDVHTQADALGYARGREEAEERVFVKAAKMVCTRCRAGNCLELVTVEAGTQDRYCHSAFPSGMSICVADELWRAAKEAKARALAAEPAQEKP